MIKYIIFDFDGTIVDSKMVFISVFNQLADKHNFNRIEAKNLEQLRKLSIKERGRLLNFPVYKLPLFAVEFNNLYQKSLKHVKLVTGIRKTLDSLYRQGYKLAIISSNTEENIKVFCETNRLSHFKEIVSEKHFFGKDKSINKFLKRNRLKPSEVLYVGDEVRDIVASKKSNVKMIWVDWGYDINERAALYGPDFVASSPQDILNIIRKEDSN